ncbi:FliM/FliN family flagellar motor C-terminal domain-containing protein [Rhodobacteraceae bacterium D3-12]|nr:FliM/FliN family flagellar motor C-terminal domain-containing protein [Rhodobacteraceae bacterium D3-12]
MDEADRQKTLRRIARTGREEHQARVMTPSRALRLALARAADELFELPLSVSSVQLTMVSQEQAIAAFDEGPLVMVLDGPEGAVGAVSVAVPLLAGLIEVQTMGQVMARDAGARAPTQTDAALVAPLLNASFAGFVENLDGEEEGRWAEGFRFGAMIEGMRMLPLLFEAADFHLFRLQVSLGDGAKDGEIVIALPVVLPPEEDAEDSMDNPQMAHGGRIKLGQGALMTAQAPMSAVLHQVKMPLAEVSGLKPGDVLTIPRGALSNTRLTDGQGQGVARCRLGQINGFRAVRLVLGRDAALKTQGASADMLNGEANTLEALDLMQSPGGMPGEFAQVEDVEVVSAVADLPNVGELGDLPELGDLGGDLSDLPELAGEGEGLPDLPSFDGRANCRICRYCRWMSEVGGFCDLAKTI